MEGRDKGGEKSGKQGRAPPRGEGARFHHGFGILETTSARLGPRVGELESQGPGGFARCEKAGEQGGHHRGVVAVMMNFNQRTLPGVNCLYTRNASVHTREGPTKLHQPRGRPALPPSGGLPSAAQGCGTLNKRATSRLATLPMALRGKLSTSSKWRGSL